MERNRLTVDGATGGDLERSLELSGPHVRVGETLAALLYRLGYFRTEALCAGLGKCGRCRIRLEAQAVALPEPTPDDRRMFTEDELVAGWRLACRHSAQPGWLVRLPEARDQGRRREISEVERTSLTGPVALAVDLGTTSIEWKAVGRDGTGRAGRFLNPQAGAGAEVMSRLSFAAAPQGAELLRQVVLDALAGLGEAHGFVPDRLCVAGNSVMTCLLTGSDASGLRAAPYRLDDRFGREIALDVRLPSAYIPPLLAPFVGADLSAGLTWLVRNADGPNPDAEFPFVLADMGTNGEFILALGPEEFIVTSVALGPALEGVGLTCGRVAGPGVWTGFRAGPSGLEPIALPGAPAEDTPGISGTGYASLLALLHRLGLLDERGSFAPGLSPLARRIAEGRAGTPGLTVYRGEPALGLGAGMHLTASDVEEALKVKAAFNLALSRLLESAGLTFSALRRLHLAGALGLHMDPAALTTLGFLPEGAPAKLRAAGNTSLAGAELFLMHTSCRRWAADLPGMCRVLDLAMSPGFETDFIARMRFGHIS